MAVRSETLQVDGVHCMNCIQKIGTALGTVDGLVSASATMTGEDSISNDEEQPEVRGRVVDALAGCGFGLTPS
jgi:copper chaperone CopZ